jgi:hypothetical protein
MPALPPVTMKTLPSRLGRFSGLKDMMYKRLRWIFEMEVLEDDVEVIVLSC